MLKRTLTVASTGVLGCLVSLAPPASAQFENLGKQAVRSAANEVNREIDRLIRDGVRCAFRDAACIERAKASGKTPVMTDDDGKLMTDEDGRPITDPDKAAARAGAAGAGVAATGAAGTASARPGSGAWANYDFVPGERVLFYDDYSKDTVGDFPRRWDLTEGNWEVVEWQDGRYLRATANGTVSIELPETLPERFTIEFPASVQHGNAHIRVSTAAVYHGDRSYAGSMPTLEYTVAGIRPHKNQGPTVRTPRQPGADRDALVTMRIMADGAYMKVYSNEHRVANAPNTVFPRTRRLFLSVSSANDARPILIGPVRVAAGGRDLYDTLLRDGRVATQGILFTVNSDVIRPESTPTLKEIGDMLRAHPDLRLTIEGHTDSDGDDASNLDLSLRRATAVRSFLVDTYGIEATRLDTKGFGETRPAVENGTPEGKQQNRRVELVVQGR